MRENTKKRHLLLLALFLLFFSLITCGLSLGTRALWGSEGRWANVSRNMVESGNYFRPTINGELYYHKPLLSYWMITATYGVTQTWNEFTVRFPSLFCAVLTVLLVYITGLILFDWKRALLAGLILATSHGWTFWSRVAQADTHNVLGVSLAMLFLYLFHKKAKKIYLAGFWITACLTCLFKGLVGLAHPLAVGGLWLTVEHAREVKAENEEISLPMASLKGFGRASLVFLQPFSLLFALLGVGLFTFPFLMSAAGREGLWLFIHNSIIRYVDAFDHKGHWYTYLVNVPLLFLPWIIVVPLVLWEKGKEWWRNDNLRFVLMWALGTFIFFQASSSRRSYYIMAILFPLALMAGQLGDMWKEKLRWWESGLLYIFIVAFAVTGVASFFVSVPVPHLLVMGILLLMTAAITLFAIHYFKEKKVLFYSILGYSLIYTLYLWVFIIPWATNYRPIHVFYENLPKIKIKEKNKMALFRVSSDESHYFYLHREDKVPFFWTSEEVLDFLDSPKSRYIIARKEAWDDLEEKHAEKVHKFYIYSPPYKLIPFDPKPRKHLLLISNKPIQIKDQNTTEKSQREKKSE